MDEDTSLYWRKLLKIDEEDKDVLKKFNYPEKVFRPFFHFLFKVLSSSYFKLNSYFVENVPKEPPYIIAPNHVSSADYPCVALSLPKEARDNLYVLVTEHFYDNPFTRFFIKAFANAARIDTRGDFIPAMRIAASIIKSGGSIYINPEGTRSETGELLPFKIGVGVLAVELNVPLVPVYIDGTYKLLPPGSIIPKPATVNVLFGKPIMMDEFQEKKKFVNAYYVYKEATDRLRQEVVNLKEKARHISKSE